MKNNLSLYDRAARKLGEQGMSEARMRRYLLPFGSQEEVGTVIQRLRTLGYLDDQRHCAQLLVRYARKGDSDRRIQAKIMDKGIPASLVREVWQAEAETVEEEWQRAVRALQRRFPRARPEWRKAAAYLQRCGFSSGSIRKALEQQEDNGTIG